MKESAVIQSLLCQGVLRVSRSRLLGRTEVFLSMSLYGCLLLCVIADVSADPSPTSLFLNTLAKHLPNSALPLGLQIQAPITQVPVIH